MRLTKRDPEKRLAYSLTEVAKMLGKNPATIHRWIERGLLRAIRIPGADRMIDAASLERLIRSDAPNWKPPRKPPSVR